MTSDLEKDAAFRDFLEDMKLLIDIKYRELVSADSSYHEALDFLCDVSGVVEVYLKRVEETIGKGASE